MLVAITIDDWKAVCAGLAIIAPLLVANAIKFWQEIAKTKREDAAEAQKQEYLKRMADGQEGLAKSFQELSIDMRAAIKVGDERHAQNLMNMASICRYGRNFKAGHHEGDHENAD